MPTGSGAAGGAISGGGSGGAGSRAGAGCAAVAGAGGNVVRARPPEAFGAVKFRVEDADRLARSPQLEAFRARGLEVLLLTDPVDNFWTQMVMGYEGKPFRSVTQGAADLDNIAKLDDDADDGEKSEPVRQADLAAVIAFVKQTLGEAIADARLSDRLVQSPACLVASDAGLDRGIERIMAERRGATRQAPVLEINPAHPITAALARKLTAGDGAIARDTAWILFDYARIADGEAPHDTGAFAERLAQLVQAKLA